MGPRRPLTVIVFFTILAFIVVTTRFGARNGGHFRPADEWVQHPASAKDQEPEPTPCIEHLGWLEPYQFTYPIKYVSRDIITVPAASSKRPQLSIMEKPLFDDAFTTVDLGQSATVNIDHCLAPLTLEVPHGDMPIPDASNIIFGLQTTMVRLKDTVKHLARWMPGTNARLYAIVIETEDKAADDTEMRQLQKKFHDLDMNVTIVHPLRAKDTFAQRYLSLVNLMYGARNDQTEWISLIDDDTFFPSMNDLLAMLSTHDPSKQQYIGSLSEDWWAVNHYGYMGFGGAGIMLSTPMAKTINEHDQDCREHLRTTAGDISVMDCIYKYSPTKLTHIPALHQVDMHGDLSGFYESGRDMLSLHHWKEGSNAGYKLEMEKMHLVADICDNCFLMRWQFPHDLLLTNGFSIAHYPKGHLSGSTPGVIATGAATVGLGVDVIDLLEMEDTWGDDINIYHSLAPIRDRVEEDAKLSYKLLDSMIVDSDSDRFQVGDVVRQVYFREGLDKGMDTVMVLNWRAGPQMVMQEPEIKASV